jgi:hypothetical protein
LPSDRAGGTKDSDSFSFFHHTIYILQQKQN